MARINLSIPDELKNEMDLHEKANWSLIAQDAFANQLVILKLKGTDMHAAGIERLRVSRKTNSELMAAEYYEIGKAWALEDAEYQELKAVANIDLEAIQCCDDEEATKKLCYAMAGSEDQYMYREAFDTLEGKEISADVAESFIAGATEVFNAI